MLATEDVQRQVAVVVVVTVEEASQLMTVQRIIGRVQVEHDSLRRAEPRLQKDVDEQPFDLAAGGHDLLIPALRVGSCGGQLQSIERALAGQCFPPIPLPRPLLSRGVRLPHQHRQQRIVPQIVMIHEVFIAQRKTVDALTHQLQHRMLDQLRIAMISKATGEPSQDTRGLLHFPEQQSARVRSDSRRRLTVRNSTVADAARRHSVIPRQLA